MKMFKAVLIVALFATGAFATGKQLHVPTTEAETMRFNFGFTDSFGTYAKLNWANQAGGFVAFTAGDGNGLDFGVSIEGMTSRTTDANVFTGSSDLAGRANVDFMIRYLASVTDWFYTGVAIEAGYVHNFKKDSLWSLGYGEAQLSIPLSFQAMEGWWLYVTPAVYAPISKPLTDTTRKGFDAGLNLTAGTAVCLGGPWLVVQASSGQEAFNFSDFAGTTNLEASVGLAFNF